MGPLSCRPYPTRRLSATRPTYTPDYGGRGFCWTFGALAVATGQTSTMTSLTRCSDDFVRFLDQVVATWTQDELVLILDNLSIHRSLAVRLWALAHPRVRFLFLPTYSPWLNLIEPWWKTLRSLALKGSSFSALDQLQDAIARATSYWNVHKHPFRWRKAA